MAIARIQDKASSYLGASMLEWYENKVEAARKPAKLTRVDVEEKIENYKKRLEGLKGALLG